MLVVPQIEKVSIKKQETCYHCGEPCYDANIHIEEKAFCCLGCQTVYQILNENGMCNYYEMNENPGVQRKWTVRKDKFAFLEDEAIQKQLIHFQDNNQVHIRLYLPQVHCSSCLWLLEHINKFDTGILSSQVNFTTKEIALVYNPNQTNLRKVVETLNEIGYEPYISLQNTDKDTKPIGDKTRIYKIGLAGFCFGNIMMMSFPEYFAGEGNIEPSLLLLFRSLNLILALPSLLYSGSEFFINAYKGLKKKFLNIDLPIALALIVTFSRSVYEYATGTGSGYFDSMTGIIFFMLIGRWLQDRTYSALSFDRDYRSYFPLSVTKIEGEKESVCMLPEIQKGDSLRIHSEELVPTDGLLSKGKAFIDYGFITGESLPVEVKIGEIVYAGGRQIGQNIEIITTHEVNHSYLTSLWNTFREKKSEKPNTTSFIHIYSQYFTLALLSLTLITGIYWTVMDTHKLLPAVTAMLIVACPCALLLSATFTYGNVLNFFSRNHFFVRNADTIEHLAEADTIVFDKTGTLTESSEWRILYEGKPIAENISSLLLTICKQSQHPLSKALTQYLQSDFATKVGNKKLTSTSLDYFEEIAGQGLVGDFEDIHIRLGNREFVSGKSNTNTTKAQNAEVHLTINGEYQGYFALHTKYRPQIFELLLALKKKCKLAIVSGDNDAEQAFLQEKLGKEVKLLFAQKPEDKWEYIMQQPQKGKKVIMIGDGLNDAGALQQSGVGIALTEENNYFTPASDAILHSSSLGKLGAFLRMARISKRIIQASFVLSILYNIVGLYFATQALLSPMIAAILMPISSISIIIITFGMTYLIGNRLLNQKT